MIEFHSEYIHSCRTVTMAIFRRRGNGLDVKLTRNACSGNRYRWEDNIKVNLKEVGL
jgi:hypothetical protein